MTVLEAEWKKLSFDLAVLIGPHPAQTTMAAEAPLRVHSRDFDSGGAPEVSPAMWSWLRDAGVCVDCNPDENGMGHVCDKRLRRPNIRSDHRNHPHRLRRALRQLSRACQEEFNIVWLLLGRGLTWHQMVAAVNESRSDKGERPYTELDFVILTISGVSKVSAAW